MVVTVTALSKLIASNTIAFDHSYRSRVMAMKTMNLSTSGETFVYFLMLTLRHLTNGTLKVEDFSHGIERERKQFPQPCNAVPPEVGTKIGSPIALFLDRNMNRRHYEYSSCLWSMTKCTEVPSFQVRAISNVVANLSLHSHIDFKLMFSFHFTFYAILFSAIYVFAILFSALHTLK